MCPTCQSPERVLWTFGNYPRLPDVQVGNWMTLHQCRDCGAHWCSVPHEPHGGYVFLTAWPYRAELFARLNERDDAAILHEWHDAVIRENWMHLSAEEIAWIEQWRDRTYRNYNPIDRGPEKKQPRFIREARDIDRYANDT